LELHREQILLDNYQCIQWAVNKWLAQRPASYTAEQIKAAASKAHWEDGGEEIIAILSPHGRCWLPKTAEERLAEIASKYAITLDEKDRAKYFTEIVTALKEREAHNG
jgi:hypothetical protein